MTAPHLRWGVLAPGGIAHEQVSDLQLVGIPVAAVGSRSLERAASFAAKFGIPTAYGSYEEAVADPDVDVFYVANTHNAHHETALLALNAGKHVLVEKAFTVNGREARELAEAAAANDVVLMEAMWTRYLPTHVRLREVLASGVIGEVKTVIADHTQLLTHVPRLMQPEMAGGALLDLGIYVVSFAWDVLGKPETVTARGTFTETGVDEQIGIVLTYPGGAQAVLSTSLASPGANRAVIHGTEGRVELDPVFYTPTSFTVYDAHGEPVDRYEPDVEGRGMQFQALELERMVAAGERSNDILPLEQTVEIMELLDEIRAQIGLRYPFE